jgi:hypothetical protein
MPLRRRPELLNPRKHRDVMPACRQRRHQQPVGFVAAAESRVIARVVREQKSQFPLYHFAEQHRGCFDPTATLLACLVIIHEKT